MSLSVESAKCTTTAVMDAKYGAPLMNCNTSSRASLPALHSPPRHQTAFTDRKAQCSDKEIHKFIKVIIVI